MTPSFTTNPNERLLNVAKALEESPNPDKFTMETFGHDCGTPACALGHYASRQDLQDAFLLDRDGFLRDGDGFTICYDDPDLLEHFDIRDFEAAELFSAIGCAAAETPREAANYIRAFVAKRRGEK